MLTPLNIEAIFYQQNYRGDAKYRIDILFVKIEAIFYMSAKYRIDVLFAKNRVDILLVKNRGDSLYVC